MTCLSTLPHFATVAQPVNSVPVVQNGIMKQLSGDFYQLGECSKTYIYINFVKTTEHTLIQLILQGVQQSATQKYILCSKQLTFKKLQVTAGCCAWEFAVQFTANKCNLNIFFSCRELPVVKSTAGQQIFYIQKMCPTIDCQKYSQSTAGIITRLKAVLLTTKRFAVYYFTKIATGRI